MGPQLWVARQLKLYGPELVWDHGCPNINETRAWLTLKAQWGLPDALNLPASKCFMPAFTWVKGGGSRKKVFVFIFLSTRDQQTSSVKDQIVNSLGLCHYNATLMSSHDIDTTWKNGGVCIPIKLTLIDKGIWISYNIQMPQNIIPSIFFNYLKYRKHCLLADHTKTGSGSYLAHGPRFAEHCPKADTHSIVSSGALTLLLMNLGVSVERLWCDSSHLC